MNTTLRPKYEEFEDYVFFSLKMLSLTDSNRIRTEQVSIVLGQKWVISFQETPGDIFDPIRERIRQGKGKVRGRLSDYLVYLLLDVVVDNYYVITESIDARVEKLEDEVMNHPSKHTITKIQNLKKELIFLRKEILPLKEEIGSLSQDDELVEERNLKYFRDVRDHLNQVVDSLDSSREVLNSLVDLYHSTLSTQMNQVMKVLTIVATIFIPLTFVAGIYGMNFNPEAGSTNMPEIRWEYGYLYFWGLILVILVGMIFYFRSKKWL